MAVETYGIPNEDEQQEQMVESSAPLAGQPANVTGLNQPQVEAPNSAPSSTAPPAPASRTPADGNATGALDGGAEPAQPQHNRNLAEKGGTPTEVIKNMDGGDIVSVGKQVLSDLEKARKGANPELHIGQGKQVNELQIAQGADPVKAGKQLVEEVEKSIAHDVIDGKYSEKEGKRKMFAFRNIYEKIAPEEMGLFLIDFGFRAMMAGESMSTLGALGAAGAGAMGALQERRLANEQRAVDDYKYSREQEQEERRLGLEERRTKAAEDRAAAIGKGGWEGEKTFLLELGKANGYTEREMMDMFAGAELPTQRFQKWMDFVAKTVEQARKDPSLLPNQGLDPESGKKFSEFDSGDMKRWAQGMVNRERDFSASEALRRAQRGALGE